MGNLQGVEQGGREDGASRPASRLTAVFEVVGSCEARDGRGLWVWIVKLWFCQSHSKAAAMAEQGGEDGELERAPEHRCFSHGGHGVELAAAIGGGVDGGGAVAAASGRSRCRERSPTCFGCAHHVQQVGFEWSEE
ncbi:hypothetical protein COP2_010878 [Malus domestica]